MYFTSRLTGEILTLEEICIKELPMADYKMPHGVFENPAMYYSLEKFNDVGYCRIGPEVIHISKFLRSYHAYITKRIEMYLNIMDKTETESFVALGTTWELFR